MPTFSFSFTSRAIATLLAMVFLIAPFCAFANIEADVVSSRTDRTTTSSAQRRNNSDDTGLSRGIANPACRDIYPVNSYQVCYYLLDSDQLFSVDSAPAPLDVFSSSFTPNRDKLLAPGKNFYPVYSGTFAFDASDYTFFLSAALDTRIYLDGQLVFQNLRSPFTYTASRVFYFDKSMTPGLHQVRIENKSSSITNLSADFNSFDLGFTWKKNSEPFGYKQLNPSSAASGCPELETSLYISLIAGNASTASNGLYPVKPNTFLTCEQSPTAAPVLYREPLVMNQVLTQKVDGLNHFFTRRLVLDVPEDATYRMEFGPGLEEYVRIDGYDIFNPTLSNLGRWHVPVRDYELKQGLHHIEITFKSLSGTDFAWAIRRLDEQNQPPVAAISIGANINNNDVRTAVDCDLRDTTDPAVTPVHIVSVPTNVPANLVQTNHIYTLFCGTQAPEQTYLAGIAGNDSSPLVGGNTKTFVLNFKGIQNGYVVFTATDNGKLYFGDLNATVSHSTLGIASHYNLTQVPSLVKTSDVFGYLSNSASDAAVEAFSDGPKATKLLGGNPGKFWQGQLQNRTYNFPFVPAEPILFIPGVYGSSLGYKNPNGNTNKDKEVWINACNLVSSSDTYKLNLSYDQGTLLPYDVSKATGDKLEVLGVLQDPHCLASWAGNDYGEGLKVEFRKAGYLENGGYFELAYDWRDGVSDGRNILKGKEGEIIFENNSLDMVGELNLKINNCYAPNQPAKRINDICVGENSPTGKVSIIAHSTGGLILKQYLYNNQSPESSHVNKAVYLGVPHLGAPKATYIALTGDSGISFLNPDIIKLLSKNLPIVADLSPSQAYPEKDKYFSIINCDGPVLNPCSYDKRVTKTYQEVKDRLTQGNAFETIGLNDKLYPLAESRHKNLDTFYANKSVNELYSLSSCGNPTLGSILERDATDLVGNKYAAFGPDWFTNGDGTVPLRSYEEGFVALNHKYYVQGVDHGDLPSNPDTRAFLVSLLTGNGGLTPNIRTNFVGCNVTGLLVAVPADVRLQATSQDSHTEFTGASPQSPQVQTYGDTVYYFFPEESYGQNPGITLSSEESTVATITVMRYENNQEVSYDNYSNVRLERSQAMNLSQVQAARKQDTAIQPDNTPQALPPATQPAEPLDISPDIPVWLKDWKQFIPFTPKRSDVETNTY